MTDSYYLGAREDVRPTASSSELYLDRIAEREGFHPGYAGEVWAHQVQGAPGVEERIGFHPRDAHKGCHWVIQLVRPIRLGRGVALWTSDWEVSITAAQSTARRGSNLHA